MQADFWAGRNDSQKTAHATNFNECAALSPADKVLQAAV
jgi:hypothetical protein